MIKSTDPASVFTYDCFRRMIGVAQEKGYRFLRFTAFDPEKHDHVILMRHDIDLSLSWALEMARIEHELGIQATYFIRLNGTFYNPLSQQDFPRLMEIVALGHEIGLHFDPSFYAKNKIPIEEGVRRECAILETATTTAVRAISQHRPFALGLEPSVRGSELFRYYAYGDAYTKKCKYISDSCQNWREGDIVSQLPHESRLQVLTHPIWWRQNHVPWQTCLLELKSECDSVLHGKIDVLMDRYETYLAKVKQAATVQEVAE